MPSVYLAGADLAAYGVPNATAAQIVAASGLVNAYLRRPEGLQYAPDAAGFPCYMAGMSPTVSLKSSQAISAGQNVAVPFSSAPGMMTVTGNVGDVVILDRTTLSAVEACVIASVNQSGFVLQSVVNAHNTACTIDFGLVIREQRSLPAKRSLTRVASWPVVRIFSIAGSYRYGRRSEQNAGQFSDTNLLAMMQTFGGPPEWTLVDVTQGDFNSTSGEVWVPSGIFLAYYSDVRIAYVAGFTQDNIPPIIKQVTATAITAGLATQDLVGGLKMARAGDTALQRFSSSIVDDDAKSQLDLYRARIMA